MYKRQAFSSENWGRSNEEVDLLMKLLHQALQEQIPNLKKNLVQLTFIGDLERFNPALIKQMRVSEKETLCPEESKNLDLVVAASYGGRWDIFLLGSLTKSCSVKLTSARYLLILPSIIFSTISGGFPLSSD